MFEGDLMNSTWLFFFQNSFITDGNSPTKQRFDYIFSKSKYYQMCKEVAGCWLASWTECGVSFVRTLARGLPACPAVTWRVTWWQQAVLRHLWSLQPANCRWSKTGPSATRQREPHKMSLKSSPRNSTSPWGRVRHFVVYESIMKIRIKTFWWEECLFWLRGKLHKE